MTRPQQTALAASCAFLSIFVVGFGPAGNGGCEPPGPVHIRVGTSFSTGHILVDASQRFETLIEARSKGRITVDVLPALASEEEVNLQTSRGMVDIQATGGPPLQVFAPQYFFFNGPYVIKDYDHFVRVWRGPLGARARETVLQNGNMTSLGTVYRGFRQMTSKKPINGPADLVGLKLRLPTVPTWIKVWSALETMPIAIPLPMLYASLANGTAEASEGDLSQISSLKLYEVQSHLSLTSHLVGVGWIFANQDFYKKLSHKDQHLVADTWAEAAAWATEKMRAAETGLLMTLQDAGMTIVQPDADAIRAKAKPAVDELFRTEWPVTTWDEVLAQ